jgi:thiamine-monophosphate kinase
MTAGEFEVIERYFTRRGASREDVLAGVGDDGALIAAPPGGALVFAVDTIVEGVHFPAGFDARFVGHRALAINLSDLAAMGAEPAWALLALTLPVVDEHWLSGFAAGLDTLLRRHAVALVGGDTTRGPLTVSLTLAGLVPEGQAILRSGARAGDDLWISGTPGDAARACDPPGRAGGAGQGARGAARRSSYHRRALRSASRCAASRAPASTFRTASRATPPALRGQQGRRGNRQPRAATARRLCSVASREARLAYALGGGDDYELLFSADPAHRAQLAALDAGVVLKRIGAIVDAEGVRVDGAPPGRDAGHGFDHFTAGPPAPR